MQAAGAAGIPIAADAEGTLRPLTQWLRSRGRQVPSEDLASALDLMAQHAQSALEATAHVDGRFLPGFEDEFFATLAELTGEGIDIEYLSHQQPWETPYDGDLVAAGEELLGEQAANEPRAAGDQTLRRHW